MDNWKLLENTILQCLIKYEYEYKYEFQKPGLK